MTLQYEGVCAGIADYAYLNTLDELLKENAAKPRANEIACEFAALKASVKANDYPYCLDSADAEFPLVPGGELKAFTNGKADAVRAKVTAWILELVNPV